MISILLCLLTIFPSIEEDKPIWLVVTTKAFEEALKPLAEKREKEGLLPVIVTKTVEEALADLSRDPSYLLIVGDCEKGKESEPWYMPSKSLPFYRWMFNQRETFESDSAFGDLDGDSKPDIPVGRIPARSREEAALIVKKIIDYESRKPAATDLGLNIWSGSPNYGPEFDAAATAFLLSNVQTGAPLWFDLWLVAGDALSHFCGWPENQSAHFTRRATQGGFVSVLMGHANADYFHSMNFQKKGIVYRYDHAKQIMSDGAPTPPMIFFSCDTGYFARPEGNPCMAESMLKLPAGPVAVIAATTNSHPLTNYFTSTSLLKSFNKKWDRFGDLWFHAQTQASKKKLTFFNVVGHQLKEAEGKLEKEINVKKLKRDQLLLFAFFGDPATKLRFPQQLEASVKKVENGWKWEAVRPEGATEIMLSLRPNNITKVLIRKGFQDKEDADSRFHVANKALGYSMLPAPENDQLWEGVIKQAGTLRIIATGPDVLYVKTFRLVSKEK